MSKESIINELPDSFVRQMRNWVKTGSCVGMYAMSQAYQGIRINHTHWAGTPDIHEATDLEHALEALPAQLRVAVMLFWLYEGNDLTWLGRRLHCDYRTVEVRVRKGHEQMRGDLARREARQDRRLEQCA